jgi:lysozyme
MSLISCANALAFAGILLTSDPTFEDLDDIQARDIRAACVSSLAEFEGFSPTPYVCPRGFLTIGYGRRLSADYVAHAPVDREQAYRMLWDDVEKAEEGARRIYPDFIELPAPAREALIQMAFQLGTNGLSKFVNLKKAIQHRRWKDAGSECLHSHWAVQTPKRARHCAQLFGSIK